MPYNPLILMHCFLVSNQWIRNQKTRENIFPPFLLLVSSPGGFVCPDFEKSASENSLLSQYNGMMDNFVCCADSIEKIYN